jgi:hypothetical protein
MQREGDRREITGVTWKYAAAKQFRDDLDPAHNRYFGFAKINGLGESVRMTCLKQFGLTQFGSKHLCFVLTGILLVATTSLAQDPPPGVGAAPQVPPTTYTPKFKGDPARSDSEAAALAYMRVVIRAENRFNKQYGHYALTLRELVHSGTFTQRMVNTDRGDYTASYKGKKDSYVLTMTPKALDAQHRSFYAEDDGKIHGDESKPADADSPVVK